MDVTLDTGIRELSSNEMAAHRDYVHLKARERISGIGGALRVSLNNMTVGSLREYIALSRHQLEMSEYIDIHTGGSDDPEDLWVHKIHWPDGRYYPFQVARRPVKQNEKVLPPMWAVEQLRDVMWRVRAVGGVLDRSGNRMVATDVDGLTELSNHQSEIANFMRTGRFRKFPRRRKARYLGGDGSKSAETAARVRELGEALKEYQGRIEIRTVREFIALSRHQCELAGMVMASEREMKKSQSIEVVHYHADGVAGAEAYREAQQTANGGNPPLSPLKLRGDEGELWASDVCTGQLERGNDGNHAFGVAGGNEEIASSACRPPRNDEIDAVIASDRRERGNLDFGCSPLFGKEGPGEISSVVEKRQNPPQSPFSKGGSNTAGSGLQLGTSRSRPEPIISDRQLVEGLEAPVHGQRFSDNEISGASLPVPGYKSAPAVEEPPLPLTLHGTVKHPTGVPAENIRVQLDIGDKEESIISLDEITDRDGRFAFHSEEAMHPPDRMIVRGTLLNRVMSGPLQDAEVHLTIDGVDGRAVSAHSDCRGRFAAVEGIPDHRPRGEPLWTQVKNDDGPQFYEWNMGWDDP